MKTKKIGILNFQYSDHNYGAVLQAAALEHVVIKLGFNAEHINYVPYNKNKLKNKLKYGFLGHLIKTLIGKSKLFGYVTNKSVFEFFRNKWLHRTESIYLTSSDLDRLYSDYSAIIVGSDQVWRYTMYTNPHDHYAYFLQFASDTTLKISYAASFGVDHWENKNASTITNSVKGYLSQFDHISVREDSGVKICSDVFSVYAEHVLDPTLLVGKEFFEKIINTEKNKNNLANTIVYYKLDLTERFKSKLKLISEKLNLKLENIYYSEKKYYNKYIDVSCWLGKIKNSDLVITDSFHCVCFSIIFNKNFICIKNKNRGESRLYSLLGSLGLSDKFISEDELENYLNKYSNIDYTAINSIIENQRSKSLNFLKNALNKIQSN